MFSRKTLAVTASAAAVFSAIAFSAASADAAVQPATAHSLGQNAVFTSNGQGGYFAWADTPFREVQTNVTPLPPSEQMGANGGLGLQIDAVVGPNVNGNILPSTPSGSLSCNVTQLGLVWNATTQQYDVYLATGTSVYDPTAANPYNGGTKVNVCTSDGALSPTGVGTTFQDGFAVTTDSAVQVIGANSSGEGIAVGQQVFLKLSKNGDHFTATAYDTNPNDANTGGPVSVDFPGSFGTAHWVGAGTVVDITDRSPASPPAGEEAAFSELRAANGTHGKHHTLNEQIFNTWLSQEVSSSANGTPADAPAVTPANSLVVKTGPGTFQLFTGQPVGA